MKLTLSRKIAGYAHLREGIVQVLDAARHGSVRTVNAIMTAAYWETGRRIVEFEQKGRMRAEYGDVLLQRLAADLTEKFGRGFGPVNLSYMRRFYQAWPAAKILQTVSEKFGPSAGGEIFQTLSEKSGPATSQTLSCKLPAMIRPTRSRISSLPALAVALPLPWSHYVLLLKARSPEARAFYEEEALRGGWSVRTLDRQMSTLFYERTAFARDKAAMLAKHTKAQPREELSAHEAVKDPLVLEFLGLKDEYSETDLEDALIDHLQQFLLELGDDFAFVARQRRLRLDDEWYRVDLIFFHRRLRCLIVIDLKLDKFTHADAGQMHLYLNYAREHWVKPGENPPVGLILCSRKGDAVARYALENLPNKVLAAEYRLNLPDEKTLLAELRQTRQAWELHQLARAAKTGGRNEMAGSEYRSRVRAN
jgi:predicted nuclease of restriction endonuclease-like (RecB) superfamily